MPAAIPFEEEVLKLIFHGAPILAGAGAFNIAQNHITTPFTQYWVSLLKGDPGTSLAPDQSTNEIIYTGYLRLAVARTTAGWEVVGGVVKTVGVLVFGTVSAVPTQIMATHFGVGTVATGGPGKLLAAGKLMPAIAIVNGAVPRIDNGTPASRFPEDWM